MDLLVWLLPLTLVCALPHQTHAEGSALYNEKCSYPWFIDHLGLNSSKELLKDSRPVKNFSEPLNVYVDLQLHAILNLDEAAQTFTSYTSIELSWYNDHLQWEKQDDCSIDRITVPEDSLWQPDVYIYEEVEKDKNPKSPFLVIQSGKPASVHMRKDMVIVTMCKMDMYKFPFDTQRCKFTIKSFIHTNDEIKLLPLGSSTTATEKLIDETMKEREYKWSLQGINITHSTATALSKDQNKIIYTITMKRRYGRYVANYISMVLFFLCLDYVSFLLPDGSDKLQFKTTILLSVTVLQLLLNEVVPSSSEIPLIDFFCNGVFCLMMCSLLESIVMMHLQKRDSRKKTTLEDCLMLLSCCKPPQKNPSLDLTERFNREENEGQGAEGREVKNLIQELKKLIAVLSEEQEGQEGYWSSGIHIINRVFLLVYSACTALFLIIVFCLWKN